MKLTVLVPTFDREDLLKVALTSISKQSIAQEITIVVSENGHTNISKQVCEEFENLNIHYIKQEKTLPVVEHFQWLFNFEKEGYVALLCDDDWWDIDHLELGVKALKANDAVAYFSNFLYLTNETSYKITPYGGLQFFNLVKKDFVSYNLNEFNSDELFTLSFAVTPFHYSSMIVKADILSRYADILAEAHPTYADRLLIPQLSLSGNILFNPLPTALIRMHGNMDSKNYGGSIWEENAMYGSLKIAELASKGNINVRDNWNTIFLNSTSSEKDSIINCFSYLFFNRQELKWFAGYPSVIKNDKQKKKLKYRVMKAIKTWGYKIYKKYT